MQMGNSLTAMKSVQAVYQLSQVNRTINQETMRQIQATDGQMQQAKDQAMTTAINMRQTTAQLKGQLVDVMA